MIQRWVNASGFLAWGEARAVWDDCPLRSVKSVDASLHFSALYRDPRLARRCSNSFDKTNNLQAVSLICLRSPQGLSGNSGRRVCAELWKEDRQYFVIPVKYGICCTMSELIYIYSAFFLQHSQIQCFVYSPSFADVMRIILSFDLNSFKLPRPNMN